jgi:hypothetical protein
MANDVTLEEENLQTKSRLVLSKLLRKCVDKNVELLRTVPEKVAYLN